ncbi:MAG: hypothetical protein J1E41_01310 [Ruminococcus sp.]|nr:hypothetical protein [Ruminococcus sp.]
MNKSSSKKVLWISIVLLIFGSLSAVIAPILISQRKSAAVFEVTRAFRGETAANFERFINYDFPVCLFFVGIILLITGFVFMILYCFKFINSMDKPYSQKFYLIASGSLFLSILSLIYYTIHPYSFGGIMYPVFVVLTIVAIVFIILGIVNSNRTKNS